MKESLELNVSQQLMFSPQLQQAIRLLQLSTLGLQQEIPKILETNPLLEASQEAPMNDEAKVLGVYYDANQYDRTPYGTKLGTQTVYPGKI